MTNAARPGSGMPRLGKAADPTRATARRRQLMLLSLVGASLLVTGRAFSLQILEGASWRSKAQDQQADQTPLPAPRGTIYDRDGVPLAASHEAYRMNLAPNEVVDRAQLIELLHKHAGLERRAAERALDPAKRWVVLPTRYSAATRQRLSGVRGVYFDRVLRRFYPRGSIAQELIGGVGADGKAQGGLELELDELLTGRAGRAILRRDAGGPIPGAFQEVISPTPGRDVYLTIDADLQEIAREALNHAIEATQAVSGEIVMADPRSGEVLAAVSSKAGQRSWRAVTEPYEPGSTLKPFAIATLLAEKRATLGDSVFAENGEFTRDGRTIKDVHPYGWLTVGDALKKSSNVVMAKLSDRLEPNTQYAYLRAFGFGSPTAVGYPSESGGLLRRPAAWSRYSQASLAIGYEISVTPLQMLMAYGALANGGILMEPALVREVRSREELTSVRFAARPVRRVIPEKIALELRTVLTDAVAGGTGSAASLGPFAVAGKTGTARSFAGGHYRSGAYTSSFAGFFPAVDPQLVFLVKLDSPKGAYYGGLTAAPVTRATLEAALAALNSPLDKRAVASSAPPPLASARGAAEAAQEQTSGPFILTVGGAPARRMEAATRSASADVPELAGLPIRDAVRILHAIGFRVRVQGHGVVGSTQPAAGAATPRGALIRLSAVEARS